MRMFRSIANKLTLILIILMGTLLLGSMLFMSYSFESYYTKTKKTALEENLRTFRNQGISQTDIFINAINNFETQNNTRLFIFGQNGQLQYMAYGGNNIEGDYIEIINRFFNDLIRDPSLRESLFADGRILSREYERQDGSIRYFLTAGSIQVGDYESFAISISSMVPINESARTIKNFFFYVFAGGFIVVAILSFFVSKTVTKPIRKLIYTSKELANLNFDIPIENTQKDEIGDLAKSLSSLASNLKGALLELQDKNKLLEEDIRKTQLLENQRKDFIRDISHELKTPITLIQGYTEGLIDGVAGDSKEEYLSIILDESKNMEKLVKDMIELNYTESEAYTISTEPIHLNKLLVNCLTPFIEIYEEEINFDIVMPADYMVYGDSSKLSTALRNIIKNAITYTEESPTAEVRIKLEERDEQLVLSVKNTPASIDEAELQNMWIQFYKKDPSRQRKDGSSGLGLSIVKNILEKHKYRYRLRNDGDGVVFEIFFNDFNLYDPKQENTYDG